jgi:hypothetical protein
MVYAFEIPASSLVEGSRAVFVERLARLLRSIALHIVAPEIKPYTIPIL